MGVDEVNLGRGDGRTAGVRGARHAAPGPGVWRPGCGARGRHHGPAAGQRAGPVAVLDRVSERLEAAPQAGRCPGRHRRRHAWRSWSMRRGAGGDRDRVGLLGHGGRTGRSVCRRPRPGSASRRPGFIATNRHHRAGGYLAQLRAGRTAGIEPQQLLRRAGLDRVPAGAIGISSRARHTFLVAISSVTDLGIPPATETISMPDSSPGIKAQAGPDCAGAGWRSRSRPGL